MAQKSGWLWAGLGLAVMGLVTVGLWGYVQWASPSGPDCGSAGVSGASIGGPFTLVDAAGKTVTEKDVIDKPALIYFGYTFCPDVCPTDNQRNADAVDLLKSRGLDVRPVFITIDPARDTPAIVAEFTHAFGPDMMGLTGSAAQVDAAARAYRVYYRKGDGADPQYYLMDHSTFTYLMDPKRGLLDFFKRDDTPETIADRAQCALKAG